MAESETNHRTVVLGVDASEHSERAFDWFVNTVYKKGDYLLIIHAQDPIIPSYSYPYGYGFYEELQRNVEISNEDVKKLLLDYGNKCKQHEIGQESFKLYKEESNRPGDVICKLAKEENAKLIVMGSRGMGSLRRTLLGSVSDYCVHHAHCPVIVVPPPNRHEEHSHSS